MNEPKRGKIMDTNKGFYFISNYLGANHVPQWVGPFKARIDAEAGLKQDIADMREWMAANANTYR